MTSVPRAMQLAARVEKMDPPMVADVCAAAALAAIGVLEDERAAPEGSWYEPTKAWRDGRIRKLVRRTRGAEWERAQEPEGVTASVGSAEVRAYVPCPMDQVPAPVAKLQIKSSALDDPERVESVSVDSGMLIAITPAVEMSWGKQAAQAAHAGQLLWEGAEARPLERWTRAGRPITVVFPVDELWATLLQDAPVTVHDGGFTEIPAGTLTACARFAD